MRHGSLFSGIGGFDLAAEWVGWENVFHCEWEEFPRQVLEYYWPKAISYEDIKETDFTIHRGGIDILTGGFPCQPFSHAGSREGTADDRYLWPEYLRAIRQIGPSWVVGENVAGLVSMEGGQVLEGILADLENEGYTVEVFLIPACGVEAIHRRDRIWIVAHSQQSGNGYKSREVGNKGGQARKNRGESLRQGNGQISTGRTNSTSADGTTTNTRYTSRHDTHTNEQRQQGQGRTEGQSNSKEDRDRQECGTVYDGGWPTEPPVCGTDDALSQRLDGITLSKHRKESLKAYGNAIVPTVAYEIFKAIDENNL